jgi:putative ABC transport system permease protein
MRHAFDRVNSSSGALENHLVSVVPATPGYFESLRIRLVNGRLFTAADGAGDPPVIIITDDFAKQLFGDRNPIGETLPIGMDESATSSTVVGVVKNVKYTGVETTEGVIYRPFAQYPWRVMNFVARTTEDPSRFAADVRHIIRSVDPEINVINVRPAEDAVYDASAQPRFRTVLISSIAAVTLGIAVIGLYGAIAYSVSQRRIEIGVRMALGAARRNVLEMVFREAGWLVGLGIVFGSAGAYILTRLLSAFLYGVTPNDLTSFAAAAGLLTIVAFAATIGPAIRATRIDPVVALKAE